MYAIRSYYAKLGPTTKWYSPNIFIMPFTSGTLSEIFDLSRSDPFFNESLRNNFV